MATVGLAAGIAANAVAAQQNASFNQQDEVPPTVATGSQASAPIVYAQNPATIQFFWSGQDNELPNLPYEEAGPVLPAPQLWPTPPVQAFTDDETWPTPIPFEEGTGVYPSPSLWLTWGSAFGDTDTLPNLPYEEAGPVLPAPQQWATPPTGALSDDGIAPAPPSIVDDDVGGFRVVVGPSQWLGTSFAQANSGAPAPLGLDEGEWQSGVAPSLWPLPPAQAFTDDEITPAPPVPLQVEEGEWWNWVAPTLWPTPPVQARTDDETWILNVIPLHVAETYWQNQVPPALWPLPPVQAMGEADERPTPAPPLQVEYEPFQNPVPAALWATPFLGAFAATDDRVPPPATIQADDDVGGFRVVVERPWLASRFINPSYGIDNSGAPHYWSETDSPVVPAPQLWPAPPVQAFVDDEAWPTPPAPVATDQDYWFAPATPDWSMVVGLWWDDGTGIQTGIDDSDGWQAPIIWAAPVNGPIVWPPDEYPTPPVTVSLDEGAWVGGLAPAIWAPAVASFADDEVLPPTAAPLGVDEDFAPPTSQIDWAWVTSIWWDEGTAVQVAPVEPEPVVVGPAPVVWSNYWPVTWADEVIANAPTPLGVEDQPWTNWVAPGLWPTPPVQAKTYPDEWPQTVGLDEFPWQNPVAPSLWPTPPVTAFQADNERPTPPAPLFTDEGEWVSWVAPQLAAPPIRLLAWFNDDWPTPPPPLSSGEDTWTAPPLLATYWTYAGPWPLWTADDVWPSPPAVIPINWIRLDGLAMRFPGLLGASLTVVMEGSLGGVTMTWPDLLDLLRRSPEITGIRFGPSALDGVTLYHGD